MRQLMSMVYWHPTYLRHSHLEGMAVMPVYIARANHISRSVRVSVNI